MSKAVVRARVRRRVLHDYCGHGELVAAFHAEALTPDDAVITAKCLWIFKRVAITREGAETSWMGH